MYNWACMIPRSVVIAWQVCDTHSMVERISAATLRADLVFPLSYPINFLDRMSVRTAISRWSSLVSRPCHAGPSRLSVRCSSSLPTHGTQQPQDFEGWDAELRRRMRKVNAKRRQRGADFVDHLLVTVRGGTSITLLRGQSYRCGSNSPNYYGKIGSYRRS